MKSILKWLAGPILAAGVLLTAGMSVSMAQVAQDEAMAPTASGPLGRGSERMFSELGLTAEQQQSVQSIWDAALPQIKTLKEQLHANSLKLRQTKPDDPNFTTVVSQISQANGLLSAALITQRADVRAQVYAVLTPAQRTKLAALEAQMQVRRQTHGNRWGLGSGGPSSVTN